MKLCFYLISGFPKNDILIAPLNESWTWEVPRRREQDGLGLWRGLQRGRCGRVSRRGLGLWPSASKLGASATLNVREKVLASKVDFLFTRFESRNRNL